MSDGRLEWVNALRAVVRAIYIEETVDKEGYINVMRDMVRRISDMAISLQSFGSLPVCIARTCDSYQ